MVSFSEQSRELKAWNVNSRTWQHNSREMQRPTPPCPAPPAKNNLFPPGVSIVSSTSCRQVSDRKIISKSDLSISTMKSINRSVLRMLCKFFVTKCMQINSVQWSTSFVDRGPGSRPCPHVDCLQSPFLREVRPYSRSSMKASIASRTPSTTMLAPNHSKPRFRPTYATGTSLVWSRIITLKVL